MNPTPYLESHPTVQKNGSPSPELDPQIVPEEPSPSTDLVAEAKEHEPAAKSPDSSPTLPLWQDIS